MVPTSIVIIMTVVVTFTSTHGNGVFDWIKYDKFDEIDARFRSVNGGTCRSRSKDQMVMRPDVVSQLPVYNQLLSRVLYANRTALVHLHNMALNRAFFYSYILQRMNDSASFSKQPNWLYYYFSSSADVNANPFMLNGSAFYFDNDCHYPNWFITVPFNRTLRLFAPKAFRWDDYRDPDNILREPTRTVVKVNDLGAGTFKNYTHPGYKMNTWYKTWLPDVTGDKDSLTKFTYNVGIRRSNKTGQFMTKTYESFAFFGPSMPGAKEQDPTMLPVQWTAPYFDCGGSNKWVVSAVSPVVDFMPRYSNYTHLRRQRIVGLIVMDIDLNKIDFNACGVSPGNPGPSYLSGIDKCKKTTSCKHILGYGLKRGGYKCVCKAGTKYPWNMDPAFLGSEIEQATEREYKQGFSCEPTNYGLVLPMVDNVPGIQIQDADRLQGTDGADPPTEHGPKRRRSCIQWSNRTADQQVHPKLTNKESIHQEISNVSTREKHLPDEQLEPRNWGHNKQESHTQTRPTFERHLTFIEAMTLADRIRDLQDKLMKNNSQLNTLSYSKVFDNYTVKNMAATDIEIQYQQDLKDHRVYQQVLLSSGYKQSELAQALREGVLEFRDKHVQRFHSGWFSRRPHSRRKRSVFDEESFDRMMTIMRQKSSVTSSNCHQKPKHQLYLPGDVNYGVHKQFEPEGRTALRLTQFLSMYLQVRPDHLQNAQPEKHYGSLKGGGYLQEEHLFGEVLANVMGNFRILSAGLFFKRNKFGKPGGATRELFGPWAFRKASAFYVMDTAGLSSQYVDEEWFLKAKSRFQTNVAGLISYKIKAHVRSNPAGESSVRFGFYPITYRASSYEHGYWTRPHFRCDGNVNAWVMTYVSPFFGLDSLRSKLEFRGVATVDVPLDLLEINQCPQPFTVANAFKNTARCDYLSTTCSPLAGFPFSRGAYMCSCRLGFEYWHADGKEWFEGSLIELEYEKKRAGIFSRFDHLYCRPSAAYTETPLWFMLTLAVLLQSLL